MMIEIAYFTIATILKALAYAIPPRPVTSANSANLAYDELRTDSKHASKLFDSSRALLTDIRNICIFFFYHSTVVLWPTYCILQGCAFLIKPNYNQPLIGAIEFQGQGY